MFSNLAHRARENSLDGDGTLSKVAADIEEAARLFGERYRRLISMTSAFLGPLWRKPIRVPDLTNHRCRGGPSSGIISSGNSSRAEEPLRMENSIAAMPTMRVTHTTPNVRFTSRG